jgi:DNA-binding FrmR family transcriptional regulator
MVEEETYCIDVLTQVAATNAALQSRCSAYAYPLPVCVAPV